MMKNMKMGVPNLFKGGTQHLSGTEQALLRNIEACQELSKITRTSLGPNGMNKMVINHLDRLFVTSDAATIMKEMEVVHPAAKLIVMASSMQEQEVGDGSNLVIVLAGELLKQAGELVIMGLHASEIVKGYDLASKKALEIIEELKVFGAEEKQLYSKEVLAKGVRSAIMAKQLGQEDFLSSLVAEACMAVMPKNTFNFLVDNVRVVKVLGGSVSQSEVIKGMVINGEPIVYPTEKAGTITEVKDANVAVFTCAIDIATTETKGTVLLTSAQELMNYNEGEEKLLHSHIKAIAESGINVIITSGTVGDLAKHFLEKYKIMTIRVLSQFEMRRLCRSTNATPLVALGPVSPDDQGHCSRVYVREVGESHVTIFQQLKSDETNLSTILLRGSTTNILNDIERAIDDGVNVVRIMGRDSRFVSGAGACELELARLLQKFGESRAGLEQYAVKAFATALEVVPRTLAESAGLDAMEIISQLYAAHEKGETNVGVDIDGAGVKDVSKEGIIDSLAIKAQAIKLASNTAITILRVDQIIQAKPAGGPKMPQKQGHWDED